MVRPRITIAMLVFVLASCGGPTSNAPAAPSNVQAQPGPGYVTVTWTDESSDETGFAVFRSLAGSENVRQLAASQKVGTVAENVETFVDRGVVPGVAYTYSVMATGEAANGAPAAATSSTTVEPGVSVVVGTLNAEPLFSGVRTSVLLYFFVGEAVQDSVAVTLTGPSGWNGDAPWQADIPAAYVNDGWTWSVIFAPAMVGTFTLSAMVGGTEYRATAEGVTTRTLPAPSAVSIPAADATAVDVAWQAVAGAAGYEVEVFDAPPRLSATRFGDGSTASTSITLDGLTLPEGDYFANVLAVDVDVTDGALTPIVPDAFMVSMAVSSTFSVLAGAGAAHH